MCEKYCNIIFYRNSNLSLRLEIKKLNIKEIKNRNLSLINQLLKVWEDSVKATHLFLSSEEIENIKKYVPKVISEASHLVIIENESHQFIVFMGIEDTKLKMLFIKNSERKKGLGKLLFKLWYRRL